MPRQKENDMNKKIDNRKVAIVGCGFVGSSAAFALMQSGLFSEIALVDVDRERAEGEALDISHGVPFVGHVEVYAADYDEIMDAAIVVITAGAAQKPGETRLDLVNKNIKIFQSILPEFKKRSYPGILLIVSNPVDILTLAALELSGLPEHRVIGSGTVLDTARLKMRLSDHLDVDSRSVHSFIIGEHGDSEIAAWSSTNISGIPLNDFCEMRGFFSHEESMKQIEDEVRNSGYEIIEKKHATYYGIAMSVVRICKAIVMNERSILSVSTKMNGEYGISDICLSMPVIVGEEGVGDHIPLPLSVEEHQLLLTSANALKEVARSAGL